MLINLIAIEHVVDVKERYCKTLLAVLPPSNQFT